MDNFHGESRADQYLLGEGAHRRKVDKLEVGIYIKSRFRGNPRGPGEAAAVIEYIDREGKSHIRGKRVSIGDGTKNALSLKICIAAMQILIKPCHVTIYIDCDYVGNACRLGWMDKWQQDGWRKANGKPPANVGDWRRLHMLAQLHIVKFAQYDNRHNGCLERILEDGE